MKWLVSRAISNTQTSDNVALDTRQRHENEVIAQVESPTEQARKWVPALARTGASAPRLALRSSSGRCEQQPPRVSQRQLNPFLPSVCAGRTRLRCIVAVMDPPARPKLKLSLGKVGANGSQPQTPVSGVPSSTPQTPAAQTPSIKLKFGGIKAKQHHPTPADDVSGTIPTSKKRKISTPSEVTAAAATPKPIQKLKLTTKNAGSRAGPQSAVTPGIRLKTRGKIPKRPLGVGYDSELEDREIDPVILEAMVLRMQPGPDCDYIRNMIAEGKVGVSVLQGGASINLRLFDQDGRRGMMTVRGNQYAISVVDLPTITEGMKSWNKKDWMKSVDISQMCLVLGPCNGEDEARNYRLHPDINPKTYQYAHGLTAPMHWVRKRRFDKTSRHRLDNIERIERRLNALLAGDAAATEVKWQVLDYNPLERNPQGDGDEDEDEDEEGFDAEGEDEDGYFPAVPNVHQYGQDEIADIEAALMEDEPAGISSAPFMPDSMTTSQVQSPAADTSAAPTPTALPFDTADAATPDNADADADDDDDASSNEGAEVEAGVSEAKAAKLEKLREIEKSIADKEKAFKQCASNILRKKIAMTIQKLQADRDMALRELGMNGDADGEVDSEEG